MLGTEHASLGWTTEGVAERAWEVATQQGKISF